MTYSGEAEDLGPATVDLTTTASPAVRPRPPMPTSIAAPWLRNVRVKAGVQPRPGREILSHFAELSAGPVVRLGSPEPMNDRLLGARRGGGPAGARQRVRAARWIRFGGPGWRGPVAGVRGEAGIGKTALLQYLIAAASAITVVRAVRGRVGDGPRIREPASAVRPAGRSAPDRSRPHSGRRSRSCSDSAPATRRIGFSSGSRP